jgi:hypothetical protein
VDKKYKELLRILTELNLINDSNRLESYSLLELRSILARHVAFNENTRLEQLAHKYGIKILWNPKFHCELNEIEGFWCDLKWYVRKINDQNYNQLNTYIIDGMEQYEKKQLNRKLWFRLARWASFN